MILERLIDALNHGPESQHAWALLILQTIFETPDLDLGPDCQLLAETRLTYSVAACLETDKGHQALQVCFHGYCLAEISVKPIALATDLKTPFLCYGAITAMAEALIFYTA